MALKNLFYIILITILFTSCTKIQPTVQVEPIKTAKPIEHSIKYRPAYRVFYGTNREPINIADYSKGFSDKRADKLYTGSCDVFIPRTHKRGHIKGSIIEKIIHLDLSYGDIRVIPSSIEIYKSPDQLWKNLRTIFKDTDEKEALIFIHGYNNSFEDAAIRAAQLGYDLGVKGITAFFSWPSANNPFLYSADEATIQVSEKYIKQFIKGFAQKSGAKRVHIIAHSMGNRGLLRAINDIQKETPDIKFGQIILAAPDVDADLFKRISKAYTQLSERTTLYVSPEDKAVWFSKFKHGYPRAGIVKPVTVVDNIDTIQVNFNFDLLALGHTYFAEEKVLLNDISSLITKNSDPSERNCIIRKNQKNQKFWLLNLKNSNW